MADELQRWKEQRALKSLEGGNVTFLKAAEMAGLSVWNFAEIMHEKEIVWVRSEKFVSSEI